MCKRVCWYALAADKNKKFRCSMAKDRKKKKGDIKKKFRRFEMYFSARKEKKICTKQNILIICILNLLFNLKNRNMISFSLFFFFRLKSMVHVCHSYIFLPFLVCVD